MTLKIPDDVLKEAGLDERDAVIEFACRLFDAGKLSLWSAAKLAGLDREAMELALSQRGIAVYRPGLKELAEDMATLRRLGK